jgi:hypothetical protein
VARLTADDIRTWKVATALLAVIATGAAAFGCLQYRRADALGAQLAEASDEAGEATAAETRLRSELSAAQDRTNSQAEKLLTAQRQVSAEQQELTAAHTAPPRSAAAAAPPPPPSVAAAQPEPPARATQPAATAQQELPIRLTFHDAIFRSGKVAILQNLSDTDLEIEMDVQTPATGAHARHRLTVNARSVLRFGPAQGWPFAVGQIVTLNNGNYRPLVQTVSST